MIGVEAYLDEETIRHYMQSSFNNVKQKMRGKEFKNEREKLKHIKPWFDALIKQTE